MPLTPVCSWQFETLWAAGVPGTVQVALRNRRKVVVQALGINSRSAVISDWKRWKWGGRSGELELLHSNQVFYFIIFSCYGRKSDRYLQVGLVFKGVSIYSRRERRINNPDLYERQTALSTKEFGSQTVSPFAPSDRAASWLIGWLSRTVLLIKHHRSTFFFFFVFKLGIPHQLPSTAWQQDLAGLNAWLDWLNWPISVLLAGMETGSRCWHSWGD